jgi:hypothetical protein
LVVACASAAREEQAACSVVEFGRVPAVSSTKAAPGTKWANKMMELRSSSSFTIYLISFRSRAKSAHDRSIMQWKGPALDRKRADHRSEWAQGYLLHKDFHADDGFESMSLTR